MTTRNVYQIDGLPVLQNRVFSTKEEAESCTTGRVALVQDCNTGLVYNQAFDPELLVYDENYNNEQSLSRAFQSHLQEVKGIIGSYLGKESLLEIGCGKAYFFGMLRDSGFDVRGCDPTYEGASPYIAKAFYSRALGFRGNGVILRHVLEHIPDPTEFLIGLSRENAGGRIYIEVPCLEWIHKNNAWFDVFYEHVNYFRLSDLVGMFDRVHDSGHLFGGQYIYIVADLASIKKPKATEGDVFSFSEQFKPAFPPESSHRRIVIWGAASKGVIYALHAKRAGIEIDYAIDVNPAKHGRYLPVTGIEVISPEKAVELLPHETTVVIMNPNYQAEIRELSKDVFFYSSANHE